MSISNRMSKIRIIFFALAVILFSGCKQYPALLQVDTHEIDFGDVRFIDGPQHASVKLKNTGDETLRIDKIATDCDCTTASVSVDSLKAGEEGELSIDVDYNAFFPGLQEKRIRIYSNSIKGSEEIVLKCNLKANE